MTQRFSHVKFSETEFGKELSTLDRKAAEVTSRHLAKILGIPVSSGVVYTLGEMAWEKMQQYLAADKPQDFDTPVLLDA